MPAGIVESGLSQTPRNMEIFSEYFKKEHLLSKVDARLKLIIALTLLGMILSYKGFALPLLVTALCLLL